MNYIQYYRVTYFFRAYVRHYVSCVTCCVLLNHINGPIKRHMEIEEIVFENKKRSIEDVRLVGRSSGEMQVEYVQYWVGSDNNYSTTISL